MEVAVKQHIVSDPAILNGKPCVAGTRLSVEFLLELLASGAGRDQVLTAYPQLTEEGFNAAMDYAARSMRIDLVWERKVSA